LTDKGLFHVLGPPIGEDLTVVEPAMNASVARIAADRKRILLGSPVRALGTLTKLSPPLN